VGILARVGIRNSSNAEPVLPEKSMANVEQFKDDLENNADGLVGGSRGDFMEALGEAIYSRVASDQLDRIVEAYLALQEVIDDNVDNLDDEADEAIADATTEFNETVGRILGV
jgi:gas vesicle protein